MLALLAVVLACTSTAEAKRCYRPSVVTPPPAPAPPVYGFPGPSFRWGWFGVNYRPRMAHHKGYYNDFWEWGYRRGY